ncbi:tRNA lysidine(34) synthetase TilS [uncultured Porphyromonas sp.]|uniref:tRNA lysidine(34) synthetase TilS n=1 Tax=uncultured Porphyromonas sp. TaxID=159274 RepID=UPI002620F9D9|nr:tRNA lysidine(34) synthetase TilS [uncultured Porphyromonas sp.]
MLDKARTIIEATLSKKDKIIVGLSGGADSIALSHLLYSLGYQLVVVHINFHLRGEESERDAMFVENYIAQELPEAASHFVDVDTYSKAKDSGISIEMAARELRYELFEDLRKADQCTWIAVGHHANDQIETALLNLSRGTGGKGMAGMQVVTGLLFRPFLTTWRSELEAYLSAHNLDYVTDSSNFDTTIKRNYIRHQLLPSFEQLNPSFPSSLLESITHFREEQEYIEQATKHFTALHFNNEEQSLDLRSVEEPYLLKRYLFEYGFTPTQSEDLINSWDSPKTISFTTDLAYTEVYRGKLYFITHLLKEYRPKQIIEHWSEPQVGTIHWNSHSPTTLRLHSRYLGKEITVRMGRKEDRFTPFGMKSGSKSLFRYLGEKGLPEYYRPFCPVLECDGEVVAVIPFEVSHHARYQSLEDSIGVSFEPSTDSLGAILRNLTSNMAGNR